MGMLIDYYCGPPQRIAELYAGGGDRLRSESAIVAACDFSIHIYPEWLDVLHDLLATGDSDAVFERRLNAEYRLLASDDTWCVEEVPAAIIQAGARRDPSEAAVICRDWLEVLDRLGADGLDGTDVTPDMLKSLTDFLQVCRIAQAKNIPVVRTWSL